MVDLRTALGSAVLVFFTALVLFSCSAAPGIGAQSSGAAAQPGCLIQIEVNRPEGEGGPIKSLVEEGSFLRLENRAKSEILAFKPIIEAKRAKVQFLEIKAGSDGKESLSLVDEVEVEIGAKEPKRVAKGYSIRIVEVRACP